MSPDPEQRLLDTYLDEVAEIPPLTPGEERRLARAVAEGGEVGREAVRSLVRSNLHLVVSIAEAYTQPPMTLLDVIQEGNVGLMRAAGEYGSAGSSPFAAVAGPKIVEAIEAGIAGW